jgi:hypothetical protein
MSLKNKAANSTSQPVHREGRGQSHLTNKSADTILQPAGFSAYLTAM